MADVPTSMSTDTPPELRTPRFTESMGRGGNDGLRILAAASGSRAVVDDNNPARMVPAA
jgi:hypothetical protein